VGNNEKIVFSNGGGGIGKNFMLGDSQVSPPHPSDGSRVRQKTLQKRKRVAKTSGRGI
jgi:hypothetical protein